jgi:hypothetical protein
MWLTLLASKDEAGTAIKSFKASAEVQSENKLCMLWTAMYILNCSYARNIDNKTPYEVWHGKIPH